MDKRIKVWKSSESQFTIQTSRRLWFDITINRISKPQSIITKRIYGNEQYIPSGTLLPNLPNFLKFTAFSLNAVEQ